MRVSPPLEDILYDLVRLLPDEERLPIAQGVELRDRMLSLASRLGVRPSPDAVRATALAFRRARGLQSADDLSAWCADRAVSADDFARLMTEEATLGAMSMRARAAGARETADFLRVAEGAELAWTRARALRDAPADHDWTPDEELLNTWYERTLGAPAPKDLDRDAQRRGFDDATELVRALRRTTTPHTTQAPTNLTVGDPLPDFVARHASLGDVRPDLFAGRWWTLVLARSPSPDARSLCDALRSLGGLIAGAGFEDDDAWAAVDDASGAVRARCRVPGDGAVAVVVDPAGRVAYAGSDGEAAMAASTATAASDEVTTSVAPVLLVPGAFEPAFCARLVSAWREGARVEGVVSALGSGGAGALRDTSIKRRIDHVIDEGELDRAIRERLVRRVFPAVRRAFQFEAGRCEGFRVGCYDSRDAGFFQAHRDDENPEAAHRRFALSVNLTHGEYEGGKLVLPEFGTTLDAPTGAAVVYSASLLHAVTPVTAGRRFALVGFFGGTTRA